MIRKKTIDSEKIDNLINFFMKHPDGFFTFIHLSKAGFKGTRSEIQQQLDELESMDLITSFNQEGMQFYMLNQKTAVAYGLIQKEMLDKTPSNVVIVGTTICTGICDKLSGNKGLLEDYAADGFCKPYLDHAKNRFRDISYLQSVLRSKQQLVHGVVAKIIGDCKNVTPVHLACLFNVLCYSPAYRLYQRLWPVPDMQALLWQLLLEQDMPEKERLQVQSQSDELLKLDMHYDVPDRKTVFIHARVITDFLKDAKSKYGSISDRSFTITIPDWNAGTTRGEERDERLLVSREESKHSENGEADHIGEERTNQKSSEKKVLRKTAKVKKDWNTGENLPVNKKGATVQENHEQVKKNQRIVVLFDELHKLGKIAKSDLNNVKSLNPTRLDYLMDITASHIAMNEINAASAAKGLQGVAKRASDETGLSLSVVEELLKHSSAQAIIPRGERTELEVSVTNAISSFSTKKKPPKNAPYEEQVKFVKSREAWTLSKSVFSDFDRAYKIATSTSTVDEVRYAMAKMAAIALLHGGTTNPRRVLDSIEVIYAEPEGIVFINKALKDRNGYEQLTVIKNLVDEKQLFLSRTYKKKCSGYYGDINAAAKSKGNDRVDNLHYRNSTQTRNNKADVHFYLFKDRKATKEQGRGSHILRVQQLVDRRTAGTSTTSMTEATAKTSRITALDQVNPEVGEIHATLSNTDWITSAGTARKGNFSLANWRPTRRSNINFPNPSLGQVLSNADQVRTGSNALKNVLAYRTYFDKLIKYAKKAYTNGIIDRDGNVIASASDIENFFDQVAIITIQNNLGQHLTAKDINQLKNLFLSKYGYEPELMEFIDKLLGGTSKSGRGALIRVEVEDAGNVTRNVNSKNPAGTEDVARGLCDELRIQGNNFYEIDVTADVTKGDKLAGIGLLAEIAKYSITSGVKTTLATEEGWYHFLAKVALMYQSSDLLKQLSLDGADIVIARVFQKSVDYTSSSGGTEVKIVEKFKQNSNFDLHIISWHEHTVRQYIATALEQLFREGSNIELPGRNIAFGSGSFVGLGLVLDPIEGLVLNVKIADWSLNSEKLSKKASMMLPTIDAKHAGHKLQPILRIDDHARTIKKWLSDKGHKLFDSNGQLIPHSDLLHELDHLSGDDLIEAYRKICGILSSSTREN